MVLYIIDVAAIFIILERMVGAGGENNKIIDNNAPQQPLGLQPHDGMYLHDHFMVTRSFH